MEPELGVLRLTKVRDVLEWESLNDSRHCLICPRVIWVRTVPDILTATQVYRGRSP